MIINEEWFVKWDKTVSGWFNSLEAEFLYKTVADLPENATIVEIGSYRGRSTIIILKACADTYKQPNRLVCVDNFSGDGSETGSTNKDVQAKLKAVLEKNIFDWNLENWLDRIDVTESQKWFESKSSAKFDMFFIDGCHPDVDKDCLQAWRLLKPGGVLLCHDYDINHHGNPVVKLIDSINLGGSHIGIGGTSLYIARKPNNENSDN